MHIIKTIDHKHIEYIFKSNKMITNDVIKQCIETDKQLFMTIIDNFKLVLLYEIYVLNIDPTTYNGGKRRKLREQQIKLIFLFYLYIDVDNLINSKYVNEHDIFMLLDIRSNRNI